MNLLNVKQILISEILKYPLITFSTQSAVYYDIARMLNVDMTKLDIVMQVDDFIHDGVACRVWYWDCSHTTYLCVR